MFLSDVDIKKAVEAGDITIEDFDESRLQPASYDILLGNEFVVTEPQGTDYIDPARKHYAKTREILLKDDEKFVLHPGVSVLGKSWDYFGSHKYLIQLGGKSSLARIGLLVHNTAGLVNPGHYLNITLELCNLNNVPIILRPQMEIGQLVFSTFKTEPQQSYEERGRYAKDNWNHVADKKVVEQQPKS